MTDKNTAATASKKQAVVVIHGMGEQRPMETIREFVNHVWKQDPNLSDPHFWNKPSDVSESFEQRRLTTDSPKIKESDKTVERTDFFEYYWAHHTVGTKWEHFWGWFSALLICMPSRYDNHPNTLKPLWYMLWGVILSGGAIFWLWSKVTAGPGLWLGIVASVVSTVWAVVAVVARKFLTQYFGDVARYIQAKPANIAIRQSIRKGGVELLERIHQTGNYDRIILVGHSLGSYVAYDILTHLWARHNKFNVSKDGEPTPLSAEAITLIDELTDLADKVGTPVFEQQIYWQKQRQLFSQLKASDVNNNWLISDFITLGSPLTYADILMYKNQQNFIKRKLDRELPTSPPLTEQNHWYYGKDDKFLHHGAVFAPVKWTNIFMTHQLPVKGDLISGPVSLNFSYMRFNNDAGTMQPPPAENIHCTPIKEIEIDFERVKNGFTHTCYWQSSANSGEQLHLKHLREALNLY